MIHFIVASEFIKVLTPYVRKYILTTLDPSECLLLNAVIVLVMSIAYLVYRLVFQDYKIRHSIDKIAEFTPLQFLFAGWIGLATVLSSMVVLTMDKHYNTPLINSMLFKTISIALLLLTSILVFKETYNYRQIFGLALTFVGIILIFSTNKGITVLNANYRNT